MDWVQDGRSSVVIGNISCNLATMILVWGGGHCIVIINLFILANKWSLGSEKGHIVTHIIKFFQE